MRSIMVACQNVWEVDPKVVRAAQFANLSAFQSDNLDMTRAAKATLLASCVLSSLVIWGVHYQQSQERDVNAIYSCVIQIANSPPSRPCIKEFYVMMNGEKKK